MALFALRRLLLAIPLLLGITFVSFIVIHLAPGGPRAGSARRIWVAAPQGGRREDPRALRARQAHPRAVLELARAGSVRLDFGSSFQPDGRPVLTKIGERLPITLFLNLMEMIIIVALAVPIGVLSATRQYSTLRQGHHALRVRRLRDAGLLARAAPHDPLRRAARVAAHLGSALAELGVPVLLAAAVGLPQPPDPARSPWSPSAGSPGSAATCGRACSRWCARTTCRPRAPRGCPRRTVIGKHALRNALLPVVTILGLSLPGLIGGQRDHRVDLRHSRHGPAHGARRSSPATTR